MYHYRDEMPELIYFSKVDTIEDAVELSDFVFSLIPHSGDVKDFDVNRDVVQLYGDFKRKLRFGWCYHNAMYLHLMFQLFHRDSYVYDYGLADLQITHAVTILTLNDQEYLIDPYFSRYYVDENDNPIPFPRLVELAEKDPSKIKSVYGEKKKQVKQGEFVRWTPQEFEQSVLNAWEVQVDFKNNMMKAFGSTNPLCLLPKKIQKTRVLKKITGARYYEFF